MTDFGPYAAAIARHEEAVGRLAPSPTEPGNNGPRLSPAFVEWMMMLPAGHVTDPAIGLSRSQQLKALGNGVVPAQAAMALQMLRQRNGNGDADSLPAIAALLPTPVVNDMGDNKTPPQWDHWTDAMKNRHSNGNGHGRSLAIEAQRISHE